MKQTAVNWLIEQYRELIIDAEINDTHYSVLDKKREEIFEQAKGMEKEQIEDAFASGVYDGGENVSQYNMDSEQYYNETYKNKL